MCMMTRVLAFNEFTVVQVLVVATIVYSSSFVVQETFEGDVHLVSGGTTNFEGILQVQTQKQWTVVCYQYKGTKVTNVGAAAAACRQGGYPTIEDWGTAESLHFNQADNLKDINMAITGIQCPDVKLALSEDEIFLLRCDYNVTLVPKEECDGFVGVICDDTIPHYTDYNGKISRKNDGDHTKLFMILFEGQSLPVCTSDLSDTAADSACRQIGFTESDYHRAYPKTTGKSWKIHDLSVCDRVNTSLPCFTDCIDQSFGYTLVDQCDGNQYELSCKFDKKYDGVFSSGNQFICSYPSASTDVPLDALGGVVALLSIISLGLFVTLACMCYCPPPNDNRAANQKYYKALWEKFRNWLRPNNGGQNNEAQPLLDNQV